MHACVNTINATGGCVAASNTLDVKCYVVKHNVDLY